MLYNKILQSQTQTQITKGKEQNPTQRRWNFHKITFKEVNREIVSLTKMVV